MSFDQFSGYAVTCDASGCHAIGPIVTVGRVPEDGSLRERAREKAIVVGWSVAGTKDFCPLHTTAGQRQ